MPHAPSIRGSLHEPLLFLRLRMMRLLQVAPSLRQVALELLLLRLENEEKKRIPLGIKHATMVNKGEQGDEW